MNLTDRASVAVPLRLEPQTGGLEVASLSARPSVRETLVVTAIAAAAMIGLYSGLDGRNAMLLSEGTPFFVPLTALDQKIPLFVPFVWLYYTYFPLTLAIHFVTRLRREWLFEALAGYLVLACAGFVFFTTFPSQMPQPSLASCADADCRALDLMYRSDEGFNAFPSMHVAYSVYVASFFWTHARKWALIPILLACGITASTLLCKRHFLVDLPVGAALALAARPVAKRAAKRFARLFRFLA